MQMGGVTLKGPFTPITINIKITIKVLKFVLNLKEFAEFTLQL